MNIEICNDVDIDADELVEEARSSIESMIEDVLDTRDEDASELSAHDIRNLIGEAQAATLQSAAFRHAVREAVKVMIDSGFLVLKGNVAMYTAPSDLA